LKNNVEHNLLKKLERIEENMEINTISDSFKEIEIFELVKDYMPIDFYESSNR
jgi:hypothetical protein